MTDRVVAGRYRLLEHIGAGGMGVVWKAADTGDAGRTVALKQVRTDPAASAGDRARTLRRLRREAEVAAGIPPHPGVVAVHGFVEFEGEPWLVMDHVPGRDLGALVSSAGAFPQARVAAIGARLAAGIAHLHAAGVVHGDVTPRNVLVTTDDEGVDHVRITDFGIARVQAEETLTRTGLPFGVPAYLAPEVVRGRYPTERSDVFGMGAVLHHALTGAGPWGDGTDQRTVLAAALRGDAALPPRAGGLAPVLRALLRRRPADRPSARQAATLLATVAEGGRVRSRPARRTLATVLAVAVVVAAAAATVALTVLRPAAPVPVPAAAPAVDAAPLGDPRTVEVCALISAPAMDRFGETHLETDYGNFDRCDVTVEQAGAAVLATVTIEDTPAEGLPAGTTSTVDGRTVVRHPVLGGQCERQIGLPGGVDVDVRARLDQGSGPDLCAIADTVTGTALDVLAAGPVPRRAVPLVPPSLGAVDACSLLDPADLAAAGVVDPTPAPSFGRWSCGWGGPGDPTTVRIRFDRNDGGLEPDDGTPVRLDGPGEVVRSAATEPDDDLRGCSVTVEYRPYVTPAGDSSAELLVVEVGHDTDASDPCTGAVPVARAAVARLPAP